MRKGTWLARPALSRGSSHVWTAPFRSSSYSAWDKNGPNSIRLAVSSGRIVGGLLLGNQTLADPLHQLIEDEADVSHYEARLLAGDTDLLQVIGEVWRDWQDERRKIYS